MVLRVWRDTCQDSNMPETHEPELIAACKRGDKGAIAKLFEQNYPSSLRVARGILRSQEESEDAVQSAYLSAYLHLDSFRGDAAFKTWITRIVTNQCLMRLRHSEFRIHWIDFDDLAGKRGLSLLTSTAPTPEKSTFCQEIGSALSAAAASLPKHLREVFNLHSVLGLSLNEVAEATGLTLPATKARLFRAQARMREHLQPLWSNVRMHRGAAQSGRPGQSDCDVRREAA